MKGLFFTKSGAEWEIVSPMTLASDGNLVVAVMRVSGGYIDTIDILMVPNVYRKPEQKRMAVKSELVRCAADFSLLKDRLGNSIRIDSEPMVFHGFTRDADGEPCAILENGNGEVLTECAHYIRFVKDGE